MPDEDMLGKLTTTTTVGTNGILLGNQMREFIRLAVDQQVMIKDAQKLRAEGGKVMWSNLDFAEPVTIWGMAGSDWPAYGDSDPSTTDLSLQTIAVEAKVKLDKVVLPSWNIEGEAFEGTVINQLAKAFGNDLEYAAIQAVSGGPNVYSGALGTGMLSKFNGWHELARTQGTIYDHAGDQVNAKLFYETWQSLPLKYRVNRQSYRFYVSPDVASAWARYLASVGHAATSEGWATNTDKGYVLGAAGIQIVEVPKIPVNLAGVLSQSAVTAATHSFILLAQPANIVTAYDPEVTWEVGIESDIRRKVIWTKAGFVAGYINPASTVVACNLLPTPDGTVTA